MSLVPRLYRSSDAGAPALTGQTGALVEVLRAVLVTGYGSGGGAKPAAGWTELFAGTDKAAFRNDPVSGTGGVIRVDDSATESGANARFAWLRAYEAMSDIDTGTGPAPTPAQATLGMLAIKSSTLDSTSRGWVAIANERWCYLFVDPGNSGSWAGIASLPLFFGDLDTRRVADGYHFALMATTLSTYAGGIGLSDGLFKAVPMTQTTATCMYLLRPYTQTGTAAKAWVNTLSDGVASSAIGAEGTYPDVISGGLLLERVLVSEGARKIRGFLPGIYGTICGKPFPDMQLRSDIEGLPIGTAVLAKSFSHGFVDPSYWPYYAGQLFFDMTNEA